MATPKQMVKDFFIGCAYGAIVEFFCMWLPSILHYFKNKN